MKTAAIAAGWEDGPALHLGASVWGALVGTTIATPADVVMSRERTCIHAPLHQIVANRFRPLRGDDLIVVIRSARIRVPADLDGIIITQERHAAHRIQQVFAGW